MSGAVKAYISRPDSGVSGLRPDLYDADRVWLERTAEDEARRILAETEPTGHANRSGQWAGDDPFPSVRYMEDYSGKRALAESLAAFIADDDAR